MSLKVSKMNEEAHAFEIKKRRTQDDPDTLPSLFVYRDGVIRGVNAGKAGAVFLGSFNAREKEASSTGSPGVTRCKTVSIIPMSCTCLGKSPVIRQQRLPR